MSKKEGIEKKTEELVLPILGEMELELYDVEFVKEGADMYLRIYIDKDGGVTIEDCEALSRRMDELLDAEDFISDAYIFEVSSPGLGRKLTKDRHYEKSLGDEVEIKLYAPLDGAKEFTGILKSFGDGKIIIEAASGDMEFLKSDIASCRLTIDF